MEIKSDSKVTVLYKGTLDNGEVFDENSEDSPLEAKLSENQLIPGFEKALIGMKVGEEKDFKIPSEEAYKDYDENLIQKIPKDKLVGEIELEEGKELVLSTQGFPQPLRAKIVKIEGDTVHLDFNHPLAGKDLNFHVKVLKIE